MRFRDYIREEWIISSSSYGKGEPRDIFKNPSSGELKELKKASWKHGVLRGILSNRQDLYLFAGDLVHSFAQNAMARVGENIGKSNIYFALDWKDKEISIYPQIAWTGPSITDDPQVIKLRRALKNLFPDIDKWDIKKV